jgi:hypothetical protein
MDIWQNGYLLGKMAIRQNGHYAKWSLGEMTLGEINGIK